MNNTKWTEIFKAFYYDIECSEDPKLSKKLIHWTAKSTNGFVYNYSTWTHFSTNCRGSKDIEWLKIDLTPENRKIVLDILKRIHVSGEVFEDCVYVYGYRTDVDYIQQRRPTMRHTVSLFLLLTLTLVLLPSCAPSNTFEAGHPITPDELESISAELFATEEQPTVSDESEEANPNTMVYWVKDGTVYHLDPDCSHLTGKRNVKGTTLRTAEANGLRMCKDCQSK